MTFNFTITTTAEVKDDKINYDLKEIEKFINNKLVDETFGSSIDDFFLGYEIADPKGKLKHYKETANLRRYGKRYILVVKQFDYRDLKDRSPIEQFIILKTKILEAVSDIQKLNRKPKDFDRQKFQNVLQQILTTYEKKLSR
jgi:hypothetical protein